MPNSSKIALGNERIRVAIVDDHDAIRLGFAGALTGHEIDLVASCPTVDDFVSKVAANSCQIVLLDLSLADGSLVADNVQRILRHGSQVLIYSIADKPAMVRAAIKAGAATLVQKSQSMDDLLDAIRLVASGIYVNDSETTNAIDADLEFKQATLTPREREVLSLYASGMLLKQVASTLGISNATVKEHIDRVRAKYADIGKPAANKTDLYLRAVEDGIIDEGKI